MLPALPMRFGSWGSNRPLIITSYIKAANFYRASICFDKVSDRCLLQVRDKSSTRRRLDKDVKSICMLDRDKIPIWQLYPISVSLNTLSARHVVISNSSNH